MRQIASEIIYALTHRWKPLRGRNEEMIETILPVLERHFGEPFMVKIVRCSVNTYWYANKIGETFMVVPHSSTSYRTQDHFYKGIDIEDCIRIPKDPETLEVRVTKDCGIKGEVFKVKQDECTEYLWKVVEGRIRGTMDKSFVEIIPPYDKSKYRLLERGVPPQEGDEYYADENKIWAPSKN